jgi:hypothetical protein
VINVKTVRSKIWKSGKNYVTSLPTELAEKILEKFDGYIEKIQIGDKIILTPPYDRFVKEGFKSCSSPDDTVKLRMEIVSAYIAGYDEVYLEDLEESREIENKISKSLDEISYLIAKKEFTPTGLFKIEFYEYTSSITSLQKEVENVFDSMTKKTSEIFSNNLSIEEFKRHSEQIKRLEQRLDEVTIYLKRNLNKALKYVDEFEKLNLKKDSDIMHLIGIYTYYERLGDLHKEILERYEEAQSYEFDVKPFRDYYTLVSRMILETFEGFKNYENTLKIIRGRREHEKWSSYENGKLIEAKTKMKEYILSLDEPALIRHLTIMEGKLRAIPDLCSNICELIYNMRRY